MLSEGLFKMLFPVPGKARPAGFYFSSASRYLDSPRKSPAFTQNPVRRPRAPCCGLHFRPFQQRLGQGAARSESPTGYSTGPLEWCCCWSLRCPRGKYFFLFSNLPPDGTGAGEMDLIRGYESGDMIPGRGYQFALSSSGILVYPTDIITVTVPD